MFCLASLIVGCAKSPSPTVEVRYEQIEIPGSLLLGCEGPEWTGGTYRDLAILAEERRTVILNCDARFKEIRNYQESLKVR